MKQVFLIYFFFRYDNIHRLVIAIGMKLFHTLHIKGNANAQSFDALRQITVIVAAAIAHAVFILVKGHHGANDNVQLRRVNEAGFFFNRLGDSHAACLP